MFIYFFKNLHLLQIYLLYNSNYNKCIKKNYFNKEIHKININKCLKI